ncbi:hypothetical protein EB001_09775 [bacterium]|nr:hypothetical protein [bacterium]
MEYTHIENGKRVSKEMKVFTIKDLDMFLAEIGFIKGVSDGANSYYRNPKMQGIVVWKNWDHGNVLSVIGSKGLVSDSVIGFAMTSNNECCFYPVEWVEDFALRGENIELSAKQVMDYVLELIREGWKML